mmetsp:Transcript_23724/g.21087  ORF Transcript_23724/g.21087 Transcript_23724/m.21087 type:complete len:193 (+) Transcript_23724:32-610(+)
MALFLKGKYLGFFPNGKTGAFRDIFRFSKSSENKISMEVTRRDMTTFMRRFWKIESNKLTLHPLNEEDPRQGGKVEVKTLLFNIRTLTFSIKTQYGIYGDDFIQFGEFSGEASPLEDEERLLKITESIQDSDDIMYKSTLKFENDNLTFAYETNDTLADPDFHIPVEKNELLFTPKTSWSEKFFYGVGNTNM